MFAGNQRGDEFLNVPWCRSGLKPEGHSPVMQKGSLMFGWWLESRVPYFGKVVLEMREVYVLSSY